MSRESFLQSEKLYFMDSVLFFSFKDMICRCLNRCPIQPKSDERTTTKAFAAGED